MVIDKGIIIALLASPVLVELIRWAKEVLSERKLNKAVCALLRDRILHLCKKYTDAKEISHKEYESLYNLHKSYKALGGNGFIDEEMKLVKELPRI